MDSLKDFTNIVYKKQNLTEKQVVACIDHLTSENIDVQDKEDFLTFLAKKGESTEEIASFINYFRILSKDPELNEFENHAIDLCGTGGDKAGSFNISTFVAFIIASSGIPVIKHGNRSISSKCGSADLLEAIGIPLELRNDQLRESVQKLNFTFLFAPSFHPAFKNLASVRKKLAAQGVITIFNILGPMINPARPGHQLLGVYSKNLVKKVAKSLSKTGMNAGFVVHGSIDEDSEISGVDEVTSSGKNLICGFGETKQFQYSDLGPEAFGLTHSPISDIKGGNIEDNLKLMNDILIGQAPAGLYSSIFMNASLAFLSTGRTKDLGEGVELAKKQIKDGKVKAWLDKVSSFYSS